MRITLELIMTNKCDNCARYMKNIKALSDQNASYSLIIETLRDEISLKDIKIDEIKIFIDKYKEEKISSSDVFAKLNKILNSFEY